MPAKPEIIRRIEEETGLKLEKNSNPGYELKDGRVTFIFMRDQELTRIPETTIGLDCLLSFDDNRITEVPPNLGTNNGNHHISLRGNLIESLPPECVNWAVIPAFAKNAPLGQFCVYLDDNPLKNPPPEIVAEGIEAIRSWFAARGKSRQRPRVSPARSQPQMPAARPRRAQQKTPAETRAKYQQQTPVETPGKPQQRTTAETPERHSVRGSASPPLRQVKIFLCYRREDTQGFAGRIFDNLAGKYGEQHIFRDIDSTPAGTRYSAWIESRVRQCSVMVVLIGNAWLSSKDRAGQRRLDLPKDWVRREIEAALSNDIPIIPVRVQGADMPSEEDLPPSIADLSEFQSAEVADSRWAYDVGLLIRAIDDLNAAEGR